MSKKVPVRITTNNAKGSYRITGDGANADATTVRGRWGYWNWSRISNVLQRAQAAGQPVVHVSGKKEKKFWNKVLARIEKLAPN